MKLLINPARIRSAIAGATTEKEIELSLRAHKIRFTYDTSAGFLAFRIPARSGAVLVYRTCSRSAPFMVRAAAAVPVVYPYRLPGYSWDD